MGTRQDLHDLLITVAGPNVYFQPPENYKMVYPCIVYSRNRANTKYGDDNPYRIIWGYDVVVIDPNPDSTIVPAMAKLPMCRFDRHYKANNLNHDAFTIFF